MLYINSSDLEKNAEHKKAIIENLIENVITISSYEDNSLLISEENIVSESMVLKQALCDEEKIKFGGCISSEFSIQLMDSETLSIESLSLTGKWIKVVITQKYFVNEFVYENGGYKYKDVEYLKEWEIFKGFINNVEVSSDNNHVFNIIAYDRISKLFDKSVTNFLSHSFGKYQKVVGILPYQDALNRCIDKKYISDDFKDFADKYSNAPWVAEEQPFTEGELLQNLCEIKGDFGFLRPSEDKLRLMSNVCNIEEYLFYQSLNHSYSPTNVIDSVLFPYGASPFDTEKNTGLYNAITRSVIIESDIDLNEHNYYDLSENVLAWGYKNPNFGNQLTISEVENFYRSMGITEYYPFTATVDGRLWVEPGDTAVFKKYKTNLYGEYIDSNGNVVESIENADFEWFSSVILSRTLKGIKALTDEFETRGDV